jgi:hypothetical protein
MGFDLDELRILDDPHAARLGRNDGRRKDDSGKAGSAAEP